MPRLLLTLTVTAVAACLIWATPVVIADQGNDARPSNRNIKTAKRAIKKRKFDKAIRYLKKELGKNPDSADAHNLIGYSYRKTDQVQLAFTHYNNALNLAPEHKGANEYLGELYLEQGKLVQAEQRLAILASACERKCDEYKDLQQAVDEYKSNN